jgi:hypothetical protein
MPGAMAANTTIGDSSIPLEVHNVFTWKITQANLTDPYGYDFKVGDKINITIVGISQGSFTTIPTLVVNGNMGYYNKSSKTWTLLENVDLIYYNATTQQYFTTQFEDWLHHFRVFLTPIPLNMTMIKNCIEIAAPVHLVEISGNVFNFTFTGDPYESFVYTYNSKGQCTTYDWYYNGEILYKLELQTSSSISLGFYFVLFTVISMVSLIIIIKKRQNRVKQ